VVGAVRLATLALFAEALLAVRFYGDDRGLGGWEVGVCIFLANVSAAMVARGEETHIIQRRSGTRKYGKGVGPHQ
jgi:hypothetical protein